MHHADRAYILSLHRRGLDPGTIYRRCEERIGWRGPLPTLATILEITGSRAPSPPVAVPVVTPALMATGTADKME